jgi:hypothetical protein
MMFLARCNGGAGTVTVGVPVRQGRWSWRDEDDGPDTTVMMVLA